MKLNKYLFLLIAFTISFTSAHGDHDQAEDNAEPEEITNKWNLPQKQGIPILDGSNFNTFISEHELVFVKFFAPWCGHCKAMIPDYAKLSKQLEDDDIPVVKVDATEEKELATKYGVKGFPALKLFKNGTPIDYSGKARTTSAMNDWIKSKVGPASKELTTLEELKKLQESELAVLLLLPSGDEEAAKT